jgi:hypothetical protein
LQIAICPMIWMEFVANELIFKTILCRRDKSEKDALLRTILFAMKNSANLKSG